MSLAWSDLGDTAAHAIGNVQFRCPIPGVNAAYELRQRFMQPIANYAALALNTAHATYSTYVLVSEENFKDEGGGLQTWDRVYVLPPSQHVELSTYRYNYIGYWGELIPLNGFPDFAPLDPTVTYARKREEFLVKSKHLFDYYLIGSGGTYSTLYDIPVIEETKYLNATISGVVSQLPTDVLWDTVNPTPGGGSVTFAYASNPSLTAYKAMVATDTGSASSFSIVAIGSKIDRWMGNIFRRETVYVKAR